MQRLIKQIINYTKLICRVLEIPFDHPDFDRLACQLARARLQRVTPELELELQRAFEFYELTPRRD